MAAELFGDSYIFLMGGRGAFLNKLLRHDMNDKLEEVPDHKITEIRYFPAKATHLLQPVDSFVTQKIK